MGRKSLLTSMLVSWNQSSSLNLEILGALRLGKILIGQKPLKNGLNNYLTIWRLPMAAL